MMQNSLRRKVYFHGHLAVALGKPMFRLRVDGPGHALRVMDANFPGMIAQMFSTGHYRVIVGTLGATHYSCNEDMVNLNAPVEQDIHFIPVPHGQGGNGGKGVFSIILGVALVATAFITAGASLAAAGGVMFGAGGALATTTVFGVSMSTVALFGASMILSGVASLLTPTPSDPTVMDTSAPPDATVSGDNSEKRASFLFNGVINSEEEGGCVPLCYGYHRCGTTLASGGVFAEKIDPNATDVVSPAIIDVG